jgi:hypothetical protein
LFIASALLLFEGLADHGAKHLSSGHAVLGGETVDSAGSGGVNVRA